MNGAGRWRAFDALRNTIAYLKAYPWTTFGTAAVLCIPIAFASLYQAMRPDLTSLLVQAAVSFAIAIWLGFAITIAIERYEAGHDPGVGGLIEKSLSPGLITFAVTQLLLVLLEFAAVAVAVLPLAGALAASGAGISGQQVSGTRWALIAGGLMSSFILAIAFLLIVYLRYGLAPVASALEGHSPTQSLRSSRRLTTGRRLDFFILLLITVGLGMLVALVLNGPAMVVSVGQATSDPGPMPVSFREMLLMLSRGQPLAPAAAAVVALSDYLSSAVGTVISAALLAAFYMELRKRSAEPFDYAPPMSSLEESDTASGGPGT